MITRIKSENIIVKDAIISGYVYFEDDKIIYVGNEERKFDKEINAGENYVSPGFIDLHTHGAVAGDYCAPKSKEEVLRALRYQNEHGATTIYPTLSACTFEQAISTLEIMREAMEANPSANVPGIHIEGPFFAVNQKGGQNAEYLTDADPDYYLPITEKYGDIISRWDYAPERDKDSKFGKFLKDKGITASIAHSDAEYEDVVRAIGDGVELVTHLYSCTSTITRRSGFRILGVTECAYLFDELNCELICDGKHLPPPLLKMIFKTKPHDKLILVTDSIPAAGMGGTGTEVNVLGINAVIEDGVCKLVDRSAFCGSIATADILIKVAVTEGGLEITDAVRMLTENPAKLMKLNKGTLAEGYDADFVIFDKNFNVIKTIVMGK